MKFSVGDAVTCLWKGSTSYNAKIISIDWKRKEAPYRVHYIGWNNRHDEWVSDSSLSSKTSKGKEGRNLDSSSEVVGKASKDDRPTPNAAPSPPKEQRKRGRPPGSKRKSLPAPTQVDKVAVTPVKAHASSSSPMKQKEVIVPKKRGRKRKAEPEVTTEPRKKTPLRETMKIILPSGQAAETREEEKSSALEEEGTDVEEQLPCPLSPTSEMLRIAEELWDEQEQREQKKEKERRRNEELRAVSTQTSHPVQYASSSHHTQRQRKPSHPEQPVSSKQTKEEASEALVASPNRQVCTLSTEEDGSPSTNSSFSGPPKLEPQSTPPQPTTTGNPTVKVVQGVNRRPATVANPRSATAEQSQPYIRGSFTAGGFRLVSVDAASGTQAKHVYSQRPTHLTRVTTSSGTTVYRTATGQHYQVVADSVGSPRTVPRGTVTVARSSILNRRQPAEVYFEELDEAEHLQWRGGRVAAIRGRRPVPLPSQPGGITMADRVALAQRRASPREVSPQQPVVVLDAASVRRVRTSVQQPASRTSSEDFQETDEAQPSVSSSQESPDSRSYIVMPPSVFSDHCYGRFAVSSEMSASPPSRNDPRVPTTAELDEALRSGRAIRIRSLPVRGSSSDVSSSSSSSTSLAQSSSVFRVHDAKGVELVEDHKELPTHTQIELEEEEEAAQGSTLPQPQPSSARPAGNTLFKAGDDVPHDFLDEVELE